MEEVKQQMDTVDALGRAMPALQEVARTLDHILSTINPKDLSELKCMSSPAALIKLVGQAVMTVFGKNTDWNTVKYSIKNGTSFINEMKKVERDWSGHLAAELQPFVDDSNFTPDMVTKKSAAARSLCMWILALHKYV